MVAATTQLSVKLEPKYKEVFETTAESLGLNTSDALRVFIKKFIDSGGFPFAVTTGYYSDETMTALNNVESGKGLHKVDNLDELRSIMLS
jgi:DNA-damage-inducible protein J